MFVVVGQQRCLSKEEKSRQEVSRETKQHRLQIAGTVATAASPLASAAGKKTHSLSSVVRLFAGGTQARLAGNS